MMDSTDILLEIKDLHKHFPISDGLFGRKRSVVRAVDGISLTVGNDEILGLVGESGCGKSTAARVILRLIEPTRGSVLLRSRKLAPVGTDHIVVDVAGAGRAVLKSLRQELQIVYQDPYSYMNPRLNVGSIIAEPLKIHRVGTPRDIEARVVALLEAVGLNRGQYNRYPHSFSGGQRQRIAIARALALKPSLIIADEPVSSLDVSIRAQILRLLEDLQDQFSLAYIFISHDLSVVKHLCHRVVVMYLGRIVEIAKTPDLFLHPLHPYTEALISAIPIPEPEYRGTEIVLKGDVPSPAKPPAGCAFHTRCMYARDDCLQESPSLLGAESGRLVACHYSKSLDLRGVATG
ncbi:MAG: hypothetical protein CMN78_00025 [Spirochaetales bacterium]|nr:hypothetical protein [Spirochaetales bacterium]